MPELPEVETVMRSLSPATVGRPIQRVWASRLHLRGGQAVPRARLLEFALCASVASWQRRGKYMLADLTSGATLLIHLGMSGRLLIERSSQRRERHTHMALTLRGGQDLRFVDPRRFGAIRCFAAGELAAFEPIATMGPEPLSRAFTAKVFAGRLDGTSRAIKTALLDQQLVAGVGNIYASESLHRAGIDPRRPGGGLSGDEPARLVRAIKKTLTDAIAACGTSLRDYTDGWGVRGDYRAQLRVFDREGEPCPVCKRAVTRIVQGGRSTFLCASCQR